jgi:hypothetical protein
MTVDATVELAPSVAFIRPNTDALQWLDDNPQDSAYWIGNVLVVDHTLVEAIVAGMRAEGLTVEVLRGRQ